MHRCPHSHRRPISCHSCRVRKLRCSRQFPCSNCTSRGITCQAPPNQPASSQRPPAAESTSSATLRVTNAELVKRMEKLEALLAQQNKEQENREPLADSGAIRDTEPQNLPTKVQAILSDALVLERHCLSPETQHPNPPSPIIYRTCPIRLIRQAHLFFFQGTETTSTVVPIEPTRCILLPEREEMKMIVNKYINDISYMHHVIHGPSVRRLVDHVYDNLAQDYQFLIGPVLLMLAILANTTHLWDAQDFSGSLFPNVSEAHSQSLVWHKAALDLLDYGQQNSHVSLEATQAMIILYFVTCNVEGVSVRLRNIVCRTITMARELGLHSLDSRHRSAMNPFPFTGLEAEIGRRVWWHLCITDWMLAGFSGTFEGAYTIHLAQTAVDKPKNINDEDIPDEGDIVGKPISQPTHMSYFLQRLRLAEIFRIVFDHGQSMPSTPESVSFQRVQKMDAQMDQFWHGCPAFFGLDNDLTTMNKDQAKDVASQRHVLNLFFHGQRCRIHLPYLARGTVDPRYAKSREMCLESARIIVRAEQQLAKEGDGFTLARFRMAVVLHHIFLAFTALLLDICLDADGTERASRLPEAAIAWKILQGAKAHSPQAGKLLEPLGRIMCKYHVLISEDNAVEGSTTISTQDSSLAGAASFPAGDLSAWDRSAEPVRTAQDWFSLESTLGTNSDDWYGVFGGLDITFL